MFNRVSRSRFLESFLNARIYYPRIRKNTSSYDFLNMGNAQHFLSEDRRSGYAINNGELVYVFSTVKHRGNLILSNATDANHLNCFDGYLVGLYSRYGFRIVRRETNWTPGGPDVVFMER